MEEFEKRLAELADLAGIIPEYYDIFGRKHTLSEASRKAILSAMDLQVGSLEDVVREIETKRTRQWENMLDAATIISHLAQPHRLAVRLPLPEGKEQAAEISLTLEDEQENRKSLQYPAGTLHVDEQRIIRDRRYIRIQLLLPRMEMGYYTVSVVCTHPEPIFENGALSVQHSARLIITPDACYLPDQLQTGKTWGVAVNLYALRSERNWGSGDLGDLRTLVTWLSGLNAGLVGINPLHAIPNTTPFGISPYSPISRLYRNFIYIELDAVPEIAGISASAGIAEKISSLRKSERVDYPGIADLKQELLEQAFELFYERHYRTGSPRGRAFREYVQTEGAPLRKFALFLALSEFMKSRHETASWLEWPEEYRSPENAAVEEFRKNNEKHVLFFEYVQWLIETQMEEVSVAAVSAGMPVGLYGDLAIGAVNGGSDVWMYQDVVAEQATVGAPPDDFNANGQDWGFPPMIPDKLRENGYDLFIRTIRKNMQHMGALRIDHALGLFRLFWIPMGMPASEGAYVRCYAEDLLRIIALESVRNRTLVIGEDLGTITDEARAALHRFGILSYRLFYFERNYPDPAFLPPDRYPEMALSAITTHDLPTVYGYWSGRDLDVKKQAGIISSEPEFIRQQSDRERDRRLILKALHQRGMLPNVGAGEDLHAPAMTPELCRTMYKYLSLSPSKLVLVSLDDVVGTMDQQNLPGTVSEYPNWAQKSELLLEEIIADPRWQDLATMFTDTRMTTAPVFRNETRSARSG